MVDSYLLVFAGLLLVFGTLGDRFGRKLALQAGVHPKVVSERLGHATTGITLDIYSHVQPELDAQAATTVAQLFSADG